MSQWRRALTLHAALIDATHQIDRPLRSLVERWIASRTSTHALRRFGMTACARFSGGSLRLAPQALAVSDPQHARIASLLRLHGLRLRRHEFEAGAPLLRRDLGRDDDRS